jgi:hypothetical protein
VAILFNNNFEFKISETKCDKEGNLLMIFFTAMGEDFVLVNLYGPNRDSPQFYEGIIN